MGRGRTPNIKINGEQLDKDIKNIEKTSFNAGKISTFILGKSKTYYTVSIRENNMSKDTLDRLCGYYDLDAEDYIVTEEMETKAVQEQVTDQNYENLILVLMSIDRSLKEIVSHTKTTNMGIEDLKSSMTGVMKLEREILENVDKKHKSGTSSNISLVG